MTRQTPAPIIPAALTAAALAMLLTTGCGRGNKPGDDASADADKPVTLRLWHIMNYSGPREVLAEAVERFETEHPGVKVDVQTYENDAYKTKLAVEMAGGNPPDVFFTWGGGGLASLVDAGKVHPLTTALAENGWGDRVLPAAMDLCQVDGDAYAVPLDLSCVPLWYNRRLFEEHGLRPPATVDDLVALSSQLRELDLTPLALGNRQQWPGAFYFIYLAARHGGVDLFLEAATGQGDASFADSAFVAAGEDLRRLVDAEAFPTGFNGIETAQARTLFLTDRAAMMVMGTWLVARVATEKPEFMDDLACAAFPAATGGAGRAGRAGTVVGGVNCAFAVSANSEHPELAVKLIRALTTEQVAAQWCEIGRIPALEVPVTALDKLPRPTLAAWQMLKNATALQPYYDQYLPPRLAEIHKSTTQAIFAGTMTPKEAAERMAEAAE